MGEWEILRLGVKRILILWVGGIGGLGDWRICGFGDIWILSIGCFGV